MMQISAPAIIKPNNYWTPARFAKALESSGRKAGCAVGSHIDDLVQNRRVITLIPEEAKKFAFPRGSSVAERNGYVMRKSMPFARAWCDASGQFHPGCIVFFPKELA